MKKKKIIALLLAVVAALFIFLLFGKGKNEDDMKTVIVAAADIKAGSKISEEAVAIEKVPSKYALKGSAAKIADVTGKTADVDIKKGEQILNGKLVAPGSSGGKLAYKVPKGKRAAAFRVKDEANLDGNLVQGSKVDVMVSMPVLSEEAELKIQIGQSTSIDKGLLGVKSKYLVENVEVLYVGADTAEDGTVEVVGENGEAAKPASSAIVILAVTPEEALTLKTEKYKADLLSGTFSLALRTYEDDSMAEQKEVSVELVK